MLKSELLQNFHLNLTPFSFSDSEGILRGSYDPMQFVLRLSENVSKELGNVGFGIFNAGDLSSSQIQAFSTYLHETVHWWQHIGSNFGFLSSLKSPAQAHLNHKDLKEMLLASGAFKSIAEFDKLNHKTHGSALINKIINNWFDLETADLVAYDPKILAQLVKNPYFECLGHSNSMLWSSVISTLASTFDPGFSFLPNIKKWEPEFKKLKADKVKGFFYQSDNTVAQIGTRAIFEGQARLSQLQYLHGAFGGKYTLIDFANNRMLDGIYGEAFSYFLRVSDSNSPKYANDSLVGLFLLVCDISINPTDGFPFDVTYFPAFLISNDPGIRFHCLCSFVQKDFPHLKLAINNYSREEYIKYSTMLCKALVCFSPLDSAIHVQRWIEMQPTIQALLVEETRYDYDQTNFPIRLLFSKYLRFQEDKIKYPQFFCWPGMNFVKHSNNEDSLIEVNRLFDKHRSLFINNTDGCVYSSYFTNYTDQQVDKTFNEFFIWNTTYMMTREWISQKGPFKYDFSWLTNKFSKKEMRDWASHNFKTSYGVAPESFKIL